MAANRYGAYGCSVVSSGPTTTTFTQVRGIGVRPGSRRTELVPAGALERGAVISATRDPIVTIETGDLATVLGLVSPTTGLSCTGGATFRYQKRSAQSTFASGSSHETLTSTVGYLYLDSLGASQDAADGAACSLMYVPLYDGSTDPLVHNTSQSLSAGTPAYVSQYYMGPIYANGSQVEGCVGWSVRNLLQFSTFRGDGDVYPRLGSIVSRTPQVSFTFRNVAGITSVIGGLFNAAAPGTLAFYLAKGAPGATPRVSYASSAHVKLSMSAADWGADSIDVRESDDANITVTVYPTVAVAISAASAIP